jgi:hypothetical protein
MQKTVFDEVIELSVEHFVKEMSKGDWLGKALEKNGFDLSEVSDEEVHDILIKTLVKLYDAFEEEIELEEEEEDSDEEEDEEDFEDDEEDEDED